MNAVESLKLFFPEIAILIGAFIVLFLDFSVKNKKVLGIVSIGFLLLAGFLAYGASNQSLFYGFFEVDPLTRFFRYMTLGIVAISILISLGYPRLNKYEGEYYTLFLFMAFALILMVASTNLLMIFLAIEFVSILSYLFVGYVKNDVKGKEAAIKYLLFGSMASGMMLFGMSLFFGASGSLNLSVIQNELQDPNFRSLGLVATLLFLTGVGFKVSMAPFHFWAADVYDGAPTPITAFLTVGSKALGFAVITRLLIMVYPWMGTQWSSLISLLAIITMTIGNVTAVAQNSVKRLLAYSSIAQAGYILMGIAAVNETGMSAVLVYLAAYAFTNLGAFTIVIIISNQAGSDDLDSYRGLAKNSPFLAASLTLFLLSLAGIPPLAGFIGKWLVFAGTIEAGLLPLAIAAALNSAVAAYYYFKIVRVMYLVPTEETKEIEQPFSLKLSVWLMLAGTVIVGILPSPLIEFIRQLFII